MDVGQKLRRMKHNLVNSSRKDDDEELKSIQFIEQRNSKMISAMSAFRKEVASTIRTGLKEENIDKRKKKLDEMAIAASLKDSSVDLEYLQSTCVHKIMNKIGNILQFAADEKVKNELMIERRVYDDLNHLSENEKAYHKAREKLANAYVDLDIAQKALDKENTPAHQEAADIANLKLDSLKDATITDVLLFASREQEIAKIMTSWLEVKCEYYSQMASELKRVVPELLADINDARPRPVFGVDLTEHLTHSQTRISVVIEKCCTLLRKIGFTEKGLFRVNGNNSKIRRIKAAFDTGHFDIDQKYYHHDPNSVCSALKSYLRELPDPLLSNSLHSQWLAAIKLEGENRLVALEKCIDELPIAHRDNLTYFMHFLSDLEQQKEFTSMNASNLAIVMGPNLYGVDMEGANPVGTKIVEALIVNAQRLFGIPSPKVLPHPDHQRRTSLETPNSLLSRSLSNAVSPRTLRPKEKAPPPPPTQNQSKHERSSVSSDLIDFSSKFGGTTGGGTGSENDEWSDDVSSESASFAQSLTRSYTEKRPHRPPLPSYRNMAELPQGRPVSYHIAVSNKLDTPQKAEEPVQIQTVIPAMTTPVAPERKRQSVLLESEASAVGNVMQTPKTGSPILTKNKQTYSPLSHPITTMVTDGGNNRTLVSLDSDPPSSLTKSKPPVPVKPKELGEKETSRL